MDFFPDTYVEKKQWYDNTHYFSDCIILLIFSPLLVEA